MTHRSRIVEEQVRRRYDEKADIYPQLYEERSWFAHFCRTRIERVCELLKDGGRAQVLEVGCGPAMIAEKLASMGHAYYGVDISEKMIRGCKQRLDHLAGAHFSVGTVRQLHFSRSSFDVVLGLGILEYVADKVDAVQEVARVLRPGGRLIVSANNKWSPRNLWNRWVYRKLTRQDQDATVEAFHSEEEYRELLSAHAFAVRQVLYFDFSLLPDPLADRFPNVARSIDRRLSALHRGRLRRMGNGFLVVAEKR